MIYKQMERPELGGGLPQIQRAQCLEDFDASPSGGILVRTTKISPSGCACVAGT